MSGRASGASDTSLSGSPCAPAYCKISGSTRLVPNYDGALSPPESECPYSALTGDPGRSCLLLKSQAHSIATLLALLGGHCFLCLSVLVWGDDSFTPLCKLRASAFCNSGHLHGWPSGFEATSSGLRVIIAWILWHLGLAQGGLRSQQRHQDVKGHVLTLQSAAL